MRFMNSVIPLGAYSIFYSLFHRSLASPLAVHPHPLGFSRINSALEKKKIASLFLTLLMQF